VSNSFASCLTHGVCAHKGVRSGLGRAYLKAPKLCRAFEPLSSVVAGFAATLLYIITYSTSEVSGLIE